MLIRNTLAAEHGGGGGGGGGGLVWSTNASAPGIPYKKPRLLQRARDNTSCLWLLCVIKHLKYQIMGVDQGWMAWRILRF